MPCVGEVGDHPMLVPVSTNPQYHCAMASQRGPGSTVPGRDRGGWQYRGHGLVQETQEDTQEETQKDNQKEIL